MTHTFQLLKTFDSASLTVHHFNPDSPLPPLHWAHATGFSARTYLPLLGALSEHFKLSAWDMRGHGESRASANPQQFKGWQTYYKDLIALLDASPEPLWLAGHSIGATTSLAAASARPDKVLGLLLVEPVLLPASQGWVLRMANWLGFSDRISMAAAAARRKARFASREEAFANYREKRAFASWSDEWLSAYVEHALVDGADGFLDLACAPSWESLTFQHTEPNALRWMKPLTCPVHILAAGKGSTFPSAAHKRVQKRLPKANIQVLEQASHFLPVEHTAEVVKQAQALLGKTAQ